MEIPTMFSFKATLVMGALITAAPLMAQQSSPGQDQQSNTSLTATPTPQSLPAQPNVRRAPNPDKQAKNLAKQLNLTRDQVAQLRPILATRDQQMEQLRADATMSSGVRRAKLQAVQQDSKAKIEALLNDSQRQQFEQMLASRRGRGKRAQKF